MLKARLTPKFEVRLYVKNYYRYKRLIDYYDWHYKLQLAQMQEENPQRFARLEANWQANN